MPSNSNRGVVYLKPGRVEVQNIDFPTFRNPAGQTMKIVNVKVIDLEQAPEGYKNFDAGVADKFVIDPHRQPPRAA